MARNTRKKQAEAPKVDLGAEIFASLRELEKTKGIPVDYMVERLKQGMANAYRKDREDRRDVPADNVVVDLSEKGLSLHIIKTVVEELEDTALEIHIDAAKNIDPNAQVGDSLWGNFYEKNNQINHFICSLYLYVDTNVYNGIFSRRKLQFSC